MDLSTIVPVFIGVTFLIIAFKVVAGLAEWSRNNGLPVEEVHARVATKRTETRGHSHRRSNGRVSTYYFATFETQGGDRSEFSLSGPEYGQLAEGDVGKLTHQGTRYHGFRRASAKAAPDSDF
jgi:hypothetical protein